MRQKIPDWHVQLNILNIKATENTDGLCIALRAFSKDLTFAWIFSFANRNTDTNTNEIPNVSIPIAKLKFGMQKISRPANRTAVHRSKKRSLNIRLSAEEAGTLKGFRKTILANSATWPGVADKANPEM